MKNRSSQSILLVDDDANLRVALSDFLKFEGYSVTAAGRGESALEKLEALSPDLIILDMSMPGMGGLGFLQAISSLGGDTRFPVLVLTARTHMRDLFEEIRVDGFLTKPCEPHVLLAEIRAILADVAQAPASDTPERSAHRVLVCLQAGEARQEIVATLAAVGLSVHGAEPGLAAVGQALRGAPDCILVAPHEHGMHLGALVAMLAQMPQTSRIPVVLCGLEPGMLAELQAELPADLPADRCLMGYDAQAISRCILSLLEKNGKQG